MFFVLNDDFFLRLFDFFRSSGLFRFFVLHNRLVLRRERNDCHRNDNRGKLNVRGRSDDRLRARISQRFEHRAVDDDRFESRRIPVFRSRGFALFFFNHVVERRFGFFDFFYGFFGDGVHRIGSSLDFRLSVRFHFFGCQSFVFFKFHFRPPY